MQSLTPQKCFVTYQNAKSSDNNANYEKFEPMLNYFSCAVKQLNDEDSIKLSEEVMDLLKSFSILLKIH